MSAFKIKNSFSFAAQVSLLSGFIMLFSMLWGEAFVRSDLFGEFSRRPFAWFLIVLESCLWVFPLAILGSWILKFLRSQKTFPFLISSAALWMFLCLTIIGAYGFLYFPRKWSEAFTNWPMIQNHLSAELVFGWVVPCSLIWSVFVVLSLNFRESTISPKQS